MPRVRGRDQKSQSQEPAHRAVPGDAIDPDAVTVAMIQALIPLGLRAVEDALAHEVRALAGRRYARDDAHPGIVRWGQQAG
ncbi:MAG: hypothetical protein JST16_14345, partial [Bdellovibrionales bacterium]|nr:hypothetical protein [Bdellovibrionales bacterium]